MSDSVVERSLRRIVRVVSSRGNSHLINHELAAHGVAEAVNIHTFTTKEELAALFQLAASCPAGSLSLEIGSYVGASTCYLGAGLAKVQGKLICVDTWQNETMPDGVRDTLAEFKSNTAGVSDLLTLVRKRSNELTVGDIPSPIHLAFIDGDHSYESAKSDFEFIAPLITPTGIIAFHDSRHFKGVSRVVGETLVSGDWRLAGHVNNLTWITRSDWKQKESEQI